jgi:hypothetical protein
LVSVRIGHRPSQLAQRPIFKIIAVVGAIRSGTGWGLV